MPTTTAAAPADPPIARAAHPRGDPRLTPLDRGLSLAGGGALIAWGVRRGGLGGLIAGAAGAALVTRGVLGRDPLQEVVGARPEEKAFAAAKGWSAASIVTRSVTIGRPAAELYAFWRQHENLARVMRDIDRIETLAPDRVRWTVKGPLGARLSWEALIVDDQPGRRIAWETAPGADIKNAGSVTFSELANGRGTLLRALIVYEPPGGQLGKAIAKIVRKEPAIQARQELRRFKQLMEAGEIATSAPGPAAPGH